MIDVNHLSFAYPKSTEPTIRDISFSVQKGEIFGFLGPNGAGKSTTQRIITKQLTHFSGDITVMGREIGQWGCDFYNHIGVGFELPNHYLKLSAMENLQLFSGFYDVPVRNLMDLLDMVGLRKDAHTKVERFSKGMKMRLNFVRAIMHDPEIIFLDEPTAGLDPANARIIKDIIVDMNRQGRTIFLTTHNMHDAEELCDRVAFIFNGEIPALDTPARFKRRAGNRAVVVEYLRNGELHTDRFSLEGIGQNRSFLQILEHASIEKISTEESSLEEIFIQLTGKTLS